MVKLNNQTIGYINLIEKLTKAKIKDCFLDDEVVFVVKEGDIGKAIGKKGENVRRLRDLIKKRIRIIEFSKDNERFVKNLISPIKGKIYKENNEIFVEVDKEDKARLIGRDRSNINKLRKIFKNYFQEEIKMR